MKNTEMLSAVNAILSTLDPLDICTRLDLESLRDRLESDIRMETARQSGTASIVRAANRVIKFCPKEHMRGAAMQSGRQCVCDGYRAIRFFTPLPLPPVENDADFLDLDKVIFPDRQTVPVELPAAADLKAALKISRASWTGKKSAYAPLPWSLGQDLPAVNPQYLLDMLEALPGCRCFIQPGSKSAISPLYFTAENGDGILLPVRLLPGQKTINAPAS